MPAEQHSVPPVLRAMTQSRPRPSSRIPSAAAWRSIGAHLMIPLFLAVGMAFAYLGAFHAPSPNHVPVAVVGEGPQTSVFAQAMNDRADGKLAVRTVADAADAKRLIVEQKIVAAYAVDGTHATLYVSKAASEAGASVAQTVFLPLAYQQHLPVEVVDVRPGTAQDPGGQTLFFLLVALSVGAYASAVAIAAATAKLAAGWRIGIGAVVALVISAIGVVIAGGVYHALNGNEWNIWLLGALYVFGIVSIGIGLHPFLGKWTTPILTMLFVMLNFTSSGGVYPASLAPPIFSALNSFWNGAAWLDAARNLTYFPGQNIGFDALRLSLWAVAGLALIAVSMIAERSRRALADETRDAQSAETDLVVAG
ncbi:hypothetical protein [Microbacterium sp. 22242]|uniref:hypothetical protein n=1 Tax=Microbacterium sp. 22242 TaxID=3453896 RepID=UPI003F83E835